jgi:hypothetical protein
MYPFDRIAVAEALAEARGYLAGLAHRDRCSDSSCLCRPPAGPPAPTADPYASPRARPFAAMEPKDDEDMPLSRWK